MLPGMFRLMTPPIKKVSSGCSAISWPTDPGSFRLARFRFNRTLLRADSLTNGISSSRPRLRAGPCWICFSRYRTARRLLKHSFPRSCSVSRQRKDGGKNGHFQGVAEDFRRHLVSSYRVDRRLYRPEPEQPAAKDD